MVEDLETFLNFRKQLYNNLSRSQTTLDHVFILRGHTREIFKDLWLAPFFFKCVASCCNPKRRLVPGVPLFMRNIGQYLFLPLLNRTNFTLQKAHF